MALSLHHMTMTELSDVIASRTKMINDYLTANKLPQPSLGGTAPSPDFLPQGMTEIHKAREELADASRRLSELVTSPLSRLQELSFYTYSDCSTLRVIYHFKVPSHVPLDGSISYTALSQATGVVEDKLKRIIRYAMLNGIFVESKPEHVAHSSLSKLMATDSTANDWVGLCLEDFYPPSVYQTEALEKWPTSYDIHNTAFQVAFNTEDDAFTVWSKDPERFRRFGGGMQVLGKYGALSDTADVIGAYDWASLGNATVVDVGGNYGHLSIELARAFPNLKFIVQDLPGIIKDCSVPDDLQGRLEFQEHDFFTPQKEKEAEAFVFRYVMHDWADDKIEEILANLLPYMKRGARLLVNETVLLPPRKASPSRERYARALDMQVMYGNNARERTYEDWKKLLEGGSEGKLKLETVGAMFLSFVKQ